LNKCLFIFFLVAITTAQAQYIDSLLDIVSLRRYDSTELHALLNLTNQFQRKDVNKAKLYANRSIALARALESDLLLCHGYLYIVALHQKSGSTDSAIYYLDLFEKLSARKPVNIKIIKNYNHTAGFFYNNTGQYKKALPYMQANLDLLQTENESKAGLLLNIGNLYSDLGDFKNSSKYTLQSLSLFEKLDNKLGQSFCLQSLGNSFFSLHQFEASKNYYQQSMNLKKELHDEPGVISSSIGLGDVYKELKQFKISEEYYKQSLKISREMKLPSEEVFGYHQLGLLYKQMNDIPLAKINITQALMLARHLGDSTLSARINANLIGLNIDKKQNANLAEDQLKSNLRMLIISGDRKGVSDLYSKLSEYYALNNQLDKAIDYLKKHERLNDSIEGGAVLLQMKQLEEQYKSEKKEKEIALLKKDQALRKLELSRQRANLTIVIVALISVVIISLLLFNRYRITNRTKRHAEVERMRNAIARDLHDDIGSTLSSINILSRVALMEENRNTHNYLQRIGDQSARIMEDVGDMVWSINPSNDSMSQVITRMREFANEIFEPKGIEYSFVEKTTEGLSLTADQRKNLFLIFKETINNAAKYSQASLIEISLQQQDGHLLLCIKDNGRGFDEKVIQRGNGLRNLRERAREINGKLILKSTLHEGTEVELRLPIT
jgi:signal transduction histidine kinase/Tfp pilus assembly protein PilF